MRDGEGNLILVAVAGAGKTTTILNASTMMQGDVIIAAYNRKIAEEIEGKLRGANIPRRIRGGTFHSYGLRNWSRFAKKVKVEAKKMQGIVSGQKLDETLEPFVLKLVSLAKNRAIMGGAIDDMNVWMHIVAHYDLEDSLPEDTSGQIIQDCIGHSMMALKKSIELDVELIDYDDMLYAPLAHNITCWENDWILVDEAQDTNPARRMLARKLLAPHGRAIFVGDPAQAIYGFTGADNDSLDIVRREFKCKELPLTVSYRCPKAVVQVARQYVSHITAADSAPEGVVAMINDEQFGNLPASELTGTSSMLCRKTAPLVKMAFALIRRGIPCHVEGKDIGRGLVSMTKKWQTNSLIVFRGKLSDYLEREVAQHMLKKQDAQAEAVQNKVDTLLVIMDELPEDGTLVDLRAKITALFGDTPEGKPSPHFTLSTVHKSKGREWHTVYILDRAKYMPSPFARQEWQKQQENNLIYVAVTRSQGTLVDVVTT